MFKVQENGDGSTSIFCNKTGKLICTIKSQQKAMGLGCRPVNVVEPSPKPRSYCYNLDLKSTQYVPEDEDKFVERSISPVSVESKEDYTEDNITSDDFARCLNLIPKEKLKSEPLDELKSTFPFRHLSRTKKVKINEDLHDIKIPDDLPLTSCLGVKLLNLNPQRNFCNDQAILMKIKNYDSFCRFQLNTPSVCVNFPKLRCREKKEYPICTSQKILKHYPTHVYTCGKRQRMERMITLKTGLDLRSRRLLQKCSKQLRVTLKRLTDEERDRWLRKKSKFLKPFSANYFRQHISIVSESKATVIDEISLISDSDSSDSSSSDSPESSSSDSSDSSSSDVDYIDPTSSKSSCTKLPMQKKITNFSGVLKHPLCLSSSNTQQTKFDGNRIYFVQLENVLKHVRKGFDGYYIDGTKIRIPFLSEYLSSLNPRSFNSILISDKHLPSFKYDHAYHLPIPEEYSKTNIKRFSCLNHKIEKKYKPLNTKSKSNKSNMPNKLLAQKKVTNNISVKRMPKVIKSPPLIDLTDSPEKEQFSVVYTYIFCCYACNFKNEYKQKKELDDFMYNHMKNFHHVLNPLSFLNSFFDPITNVHNVEAFPGYKR